MKPENKIRIKKLLSEGAVIVFAILLAFLIDAWWAQRLLSIEESATLRSLQSEFESNLKQVERVTGIYSRTRQEMIELKGLTDDEVHALPQAAVSRYMLALCTPWTFDPVLGTTNALVSAGKLGILSDPALRSALTRFVSLTEDADDEVIYLQAFAQRIWLAQIAVGGPWTDPDVEKAIEGDIGGLDFIPKATTGDLINVRGDRQVMGLAANFHLNAAYYEKDLKGVRKQVLLILDLIKKSL